MLWLQDEPLPCCEAVAWITVQPSEVFIYCVVSLKIVEFLWGKKNQKTNQNSPYSTKAWDRPLSLFMALFFWVLPTVHQQLLRSSWLPHVRNFGANSVIQQWVRITAAHVYLTQGPFADCTLSRLTQPLKLLPSEYRRLCFKYNEGWEGQEPTRWALQSLLEPSDGSSVLDRCCCISLPQSSAHKCWAARGG